MTLPVPPDRPVPKAPKTGRNAPCPCGSTKKFKKCCLYLEPRGRSEVKVSKLLPELKSDKKLHQFEKYACDVYGLPRLLGWLDDGRREPTHQTFDVVNSLFHAAVLRVPSLNALEGNLKEPDFQRLLGLRPTPGDKAFSAETISRVLDSLELTTLEQANAALIFKAERNKAFREGSYGGLRCVALDGWEPFCSYDRHCPHCFVRKVTRRLPNGEVEEVDQYYHRCVVALLVGDTVDVVLGIEPVRNLHARREAGEQDAEGDEGELSAAMRLLDKLHGIYGAFIDAFVLDGLYPNGPFMTKLTRLGYGAFIVMRNQGNEPLKEALALWEGQPPCRQVDNPETKEHIDFWEADNLETLDTYKGSIRVIRAVVTKADTKKTWCVAIIGKRARASSLPTALRITRARWHIENTAFHQWVTLWNLSHVFRHTPNAILAVLLIWSLAFNLLQLFVYRRLKRPRRPKDPADTIRHIVEVMLRDLGSLLHPFPWAALLDTS